MYLKEIVVDILQGKINEKDNEVTVYFVKVGEEMEVTRNVDETINHPNGKDL